MGAPQPVRTFPPVARLTRSGQGDFNRLGAVPASLASPVALPRDMLFLALAEFPSGASRRKFACETRFFGDEWNDTAEHLGGLNGDAFSRHSNADRAWLRTSRSPERQ